jgi:ATP-dependent RNA helicase SUPV3L1/SUV3
MRRLRENAELEPQMGKTGEVEVEGHTIGRLDGFVFLADASSGGSEAKALQNAAQKALAGEIAARAARLAEAPAEQFVLAADGTIRWTGAAVGKLVAGEDPLRPRARVIADEHLSGAPREAVEARLDNFVKSHVEKLLGPLFELAAAADVTGIARGVAFQLVEALGVLDRARVADDVKGLAQPERASLRKYGVRFGAYHIYLPHLLKPTPRALAAQLWALSHDGLQGKGLDDLMHLAGSGRTSIPVNREIDPALYRVAGYRVCGERAVRADILERLADLIRPALAWREGGTGQKPPGAFAGGGFTVVNTMTSLTGASGEDFASILRSLGYRMEQRPKPPEPSRAAEIPAAADAPVADDTGEAEASTDKEAAGEEAEVSVAAFDAPLAASEVVVDESPAVVPESAAPSPAEIAAEASGEPPQEAVAAAEPAMIEVWRPGRSEARRRPRVRHRDARKHAGQGALPQGAAPDATAPAAAADAAVPALPTEQTSPPDGSPAETPRPGRHSRQRRRYASDQRFERPRREPERTPAPPMRHERREKAPDPNSPFAKLAALKAQLEAEAKGRR